MAAIEIDSLPSEVIWHMGREHKCMFCKATIESEAPRCKFQVGKSVRYSHVQCGGVCLEDGEHVDTFASPPKATPPKICVGCHRTYDVPADDELCVYCREELADAAVLKKLEDEVVTFDEEVVETSTSSCSPIPQDTPSPATRRKLAADAAEERARKHLT